MRIIILGSSGHIGKVLTNYFTNIVGYEVIGYSRSSGQWPFNVNRAPQVDILINCIGVGTPEKEKKVGQNLFVIENCYNSLCNEYIRTHPHCFYIYFSSGIASSRFGADTTYAQVKRQMEQNNEWMIQYGCYSAVRLFSFFSNYADLSSSHFLPSIIRAIKNKEILKVSTTPIVRDYIHPYNLGMNILQLYNGIIKSPNGYVELSSGCPIVKQSILDYFALDYKMEYEYIKTDGETTALYIPEKSTLANVSSMQTIMHQANLILEG